MNRHVYLTLDDACYAMIGGGAEPEPEPGGGGMDYSAYYSGDAVSMVQAAAGGDQTPSPAIAAPVVGGSGGRGGSDPDGEQVAI